MITVGVDFAAAVEKTATCVIAWTEERAEVVDVAVGVDDAGLIASVTAGDHAAVDVPFGWPDSFTQFVAAHRARSLAPPNVTDVLWRRSMTYRATELELMQRFGLRPLSVAADRIASAALRWAVLAARLEASGVEVSRDGSGRIVECYPAASLLAWDLAHRGYKGKSLAPVRLRTVEQMRTALPFLSLGRHQHAILESDDLFDAFIAALTARAAGLGQVQLPSEPERVASEGWIVVPSAPLGRLR